MISLNKQIKHWQVRYYVKKYKIRTKLKVFSFVDDLLNYMGGNLPLLAYIALCSK